VLWAAKQSGVKRVVYAASSSAYGEASTPTKAENLPARPLSPYGVSKLAGELYCSAFYATYGLETVALRYFNVFGPRQDASSEYSAVIPKFVAQLLAGQSPVIFGDGEQTRDFTYIANVVAGNLLALEAPAAAGQTINLAAGESLSLNTLTQMLGEIMGVSIPPTYAPARLGDIRHSAADISKARTLLNYRPVVDGRTGLQATIAWMREQPLPIG
jgi:UDP-glucose 4-epimerase